MTIPLTTPRLTLRRWRPSDRDPFRALNADPRVMEHFPAPLTPEESDALITRIERHFETHGFGVFATELTRTGTFIGYIGLNIPPFEAPFMPAVEIGWRLSSDHWNQGLATEGARAVVRYAFETLKLPGLISFTVPVNLRSRRVMEKLGMVHHPSGDFDHPNLPDGHSLRRHVLYRIAAKTASAIAAASAAG
jgi:ribosomal-protein-alanine N-acetyltransferase